VDWIGAILERIRTMECPACGARLASCAVRGITAEPRALVVKLACTVCGESSVAIVEREHESTPAFTKDDVLDAHDFLRTWHGPVAPLINSSASNTAINNTA
jgi:transcription elongation factor Elf1